MLAAVLTLLVGFIVILAIIVANAYFVAQEFAYMSVDRSKLRTEAAGGDTAAQRALTITNRTSFMLSGAQLGITVTGLLVGFIAEPLIGESLGVLLGTAGIPVALSVTVGTVLALALSTIVQMVFGELYPKNLAIANPGPIARALARSTQIYLALFGWLITVFDKASNAMLRMLRIEPVEDVDSSATALDLEAIVASSRETGDLPEELSDVLDRILDFPQRDVEHAMIPRSYVDAIEPDATLGHVRALMASAHTRYPVIDKGDEPIGVIHLIDVLRTDLPETAPVRALMQPPVVFPTVMPLPDAYGTLKETGNELACVIDEYGGFIGILTTEDLVEEVVGELTDEHDYEIPTSVEITGDASWRMGGDVHVDEAERAIGHDLPRGDYETVAGLLIDAHGALPVKGERIRINLPEEPADLVHDEPIRRHLEVEVVEIRRRVPRLVRMTLSVWQGDEPQRDQPTEARD